MTEKFVLETPQFQGPLEALLNLIEDRKMSISDVSLSEVTDTYLAYIESLPEMSLGETAQFILVASTLLLIKSRTLLPTLDLTEEERESVEELESRLARLAQVRKAARELRKSWGVTPLVMAKRAPTRTPVFAPAETSFSTLQAAALYLIRTIPLPEKLIEASVAPVLALEDVIKQMHMRLTSAIRTRFSELTKTSGRHEVIVYFLAMLELVRSGSASATQEKIFSDITIELENVTSTAPRYG